MTFQIDALTCEVCRAVAQPAGHLVLVTTDMYGTRTVKRLHVVCGPSCVPEHVPGTLERMTLADLAVGDVGDVLDGALRAFDWSTECLQQFTEVLGHVRERR